MRPFPGNTQVEPAKHAIEVFAPGNGDGGCAYGIFEHQIPADDPGDELTHGGIGISVSAPRNRNHRSKFRVTETGKSATNASENKSEHDRRTGAIGDGSRGANEQARADDAANPEHDKVRRSERAFQAVFANFLSFGHQLVERFSRE